MHPYLIPTFFLLYCYMKIFVPYDDEVADPLIDKLAIDLEWVIAIKKAHGAVSL